MPNKIFAEENNDGKKVDIEKMKKNSEINSTFCQIKYSRRLILGDPKAAEPFFIPSAPPFDRNGFHLDIQRLLEFKYDPQKMINHIKILSDTYFWPTIVASFLFLKSPGEIASATVYNSDEASLKKDLVDWGLENKNSLAQKLINDSQGKDIYYNFDTNAADQQLTYFAINSKIANLLKLVEKKEEKFYKKLEEMSYPLAAFSEEDLLLIRKDRQKNSREPVIQGAILLPIYKDKLIRGIVLLGFPRPDVMTGMPPSFEILNLLDMHIFLSTLNKIFEK
jgi:hypothetical protein